MKINREYNLLEKRIRAKVVKEYLDNLGSNRCVCFTSGNCSKELKKLGLNVIAIGNEQDLSPNKWFEFIEIGKFGYFDATSGHLPLPLMLDIAKRLKKRIKKLPKKVIIATGSGETLVCLKLAFPETEFTAMYNLDHHTILNKKAPLNSLVKILTNNRIELKKKSN